MSGDEDALELMSEDWPDPALFTRGPWPFENSRPSIWTSSMKIKRNTPLAASISMAFVSIACTVADGLDPDVYADPFEETVADTPGELRTYEGWLGSQLGAPVITGTTVGKSNDFNPSCASSRAPDVSYTWTAPSTSIYTFSTAGSSYDTVLQIRSFTDSSVILACNDDAEDTPQSLLDLFVAAGTTVIVVVDGVGTEAGGDFQLSIINDPCPEGCNDPPTQCHQNQGICAVGDAQNVWCYYPSANGDACDNGFPCMSADCVGYYCVGYQDHCPAGQACTLEGCIVPCEAGCNDPPSSCYEAVGQCIIPLDSCTYTPLPAGAACSDDVPCTSGDACDGAGSCIGGPETCAPGEVCTALGCEI